LGSCGNSILFHRPVEEEIVLFQSIFNYVNRFQFWNKEKAYQVDKDEVSYLFALPNPKATVSKNFVRHPRSELELEVATRGPRCHKNYVRFRRQLLNLNDDLHSGHTGNTMF